MLSKVFLFLTVFLFILSVSGQDKVSPNIKLLKFSNVDDGFPVTTFSKRVGTVQKGETVLIDSVKVTTNIHILKKPVFVSTETCGTIAEIEVPFLDDSQFFRVKKFISYQLAKQTFAYEVEYEFFHAETGEEIGATTSQFYVDQNGTGKFFIECVENFKLPTIPEWVKVPVK